MIIDNGFMTKSCSHVSFTLNPTRLPLELPRTGSTVLHPLEISPVVSMQIQRGLHIAASMTSAGPSEDLLEVYPPQ
jgi:hypothetical protein